MLGPQSFAPAGDRLVFALADPRRPLASRTVVLDLRTGASTPVGVPQAAATDVAWSPDGAHIALRSPAGGILVVDAASGATTRVIPTPGEIAAVPSWAPDGTRIAFAVGRPIRPCLTCVGTAKPSAFFTALAVADVMTGAVRTVLPCSADVHDFVWTRDGRAVVVDARG